jgi:hypothetical protein
VKSPILCALLALSFCCVAGAAEEIPRGIPIGRAWAGHPVSFALLTHGGKQFVAYYDEERRIAVAARELGSEQWATVRPEGVPDAAHKRASNVTGWDSHNYLRLAVDRDGCLHLAGNMHVDPLVYYRTRRPLDLTTLERVDRMTGERETHCTYPVFFKNAAGDLLFRYRDGSSGNGSDLYNVYDTATRTWRRLLDTPVLDGEGQRNAYALDPVLGPDGFFHLVWMWRDTPDCSTNHTLSYARSRDFQHWENSRGKPLALPITLTRGEVIDDAKIHEGLINMTFNLGFDAQRRPVVVWHRYDAEGRSQAYVARPAGGLAGAGGGGGAGSAGGNWVTRQISTWDFRWQFSGGGSIAAEVTLGAPHPADDGALLVDFATEKAGAGRWRLRADTLERTAQLLSVPPALPAALLRAESAYPGMEVQTAVSREGGHRYVLRWETLPRNRDLPRETAPPPSELRLYELSDGEVADAARVGS